MNKFSKITLAILGGTDAVIYIVTPLLLAILWLGVAGTQSSSYLLYGIGIIATIFRAIKVGWFSKE